MAWQKWITHIFTWTNIIIPKHKHVHISVFPLGRNTAPDGSSKEMDSLRVKATCQSYYRRDPRNALPTLFLSLFVVSDTQCGGEDAEGREGVAESTSVEGAPHWASLAWPLAVFTQELSLGSTVLAWAWLCRTGSSQNPEVKIEKASWGHLDMSTRTSLTALFVCLIETGSHSRAQVVLNLNM